MVNERTFFGLETSCLIRAFVRFPVYYVSRHLKTNFC